jgi:hypothetical protein
MDRRDFLKVTGVLAAAGALEALPARAEQLGSLSGSLSPERANGLAPIAGADHAALTVGQVGLYQVTGRVRLEAPRVEILGLANRQSISWSGRGAEKPVTSFTTFIYLDQPNVTRTIVVQGGSIESLSTTLVDTAS